MRRGEDEKGARRVEDKRLFQGSTAGTMGVTGTSASSSSLWEETGGESEPIVPPVGILPSPRRS